MGWRARGLQLATPFIRPLALLIGTGIAYFLVELYVSGKISFDVVTIFLRNTPLYVTVVTLQSSVQVPATKQVTEFTVAYHWMYSRATYIKFLAFVQRTWTDVTREREIVWV